MEGFLDNRMSARPEKAVGEGSTIIGRQNISITIKFSKACS